MVKARLMVAFAAFGLVLCGNTLANSQNQKPPAKRPAAHAAKPAQDKAACEALNSKAKELLAQEKELIQKAKEKENEVTALVKQSKQIEVQRVSEERAAKKGAPGEEAKAKSQEEQRVNVERQIKEKQAEREALVKQTNEVAKQRRETEQQHKQECTVHK